MTNVPVYELLDKAPKDHNSEEFLTFLRENNEVLWETEHWLCIKNCKYNWPTAFAKVASPKISALLLHYGDNEWRVKPASKRTVKRFHIHIVDATMN